MALVNPEGIYTGGAVVFDSSPTVNFYAQHMAKKKAKEEALDEYYRNLPGTINQAGVRDQDRPVIDQKRAEIQDFWIKNKDNILRGKDGGATKYNYEKMVRELDQTVDASKQRGKLGLELGKMKFDPDKNYIFDDDGIVEAIAKHELPIGAEGSQELDLSTLTVPPKPFNQDKYFDQYSNVKRGKSTTLSPIDRGDFTQLKTTVSEYDTEGLNTIRQRAVGELKSNKSFSRFVKKELDNPEILKQLNPIHKRHFGKDIESYEDFAAAYTLSGIQPEIKETTEVADTFGRQKYMEALRQGNRKELAYLRNGFQQLKEAQKENRLDAILGGYIDEASSNPDGSITINPLFEKELARKDDINYNIPIKTTRIVGDKVEVTYSDGKKVDLGLQDFKGVMRKVMNQPVTPEDAATPTVPKPKPSTYIIKGKKYTEAELKKLGYTADQIAPYKQ